MIDWSWAWWLPMLIPILEEDDTPYIWWAGKSPYLWGLYRVGELEVEC